MKFLYVGATPEVERPVLQTVSDRLGVAFGLPVRELALPPIEFAFDAARRQYASSGVLEMLMRGCPKDAIKLLAVTERDLFIPVLTFVYGHAQLGGRVGAVSLARLRQEFYGLPSNHQVLLERVRKEALHEAGHIFGLVHCADRQCAMALATNIGQIDRKRDGFCAACAARLGKGTPVGPSHEERP
jgi:archaemetzincin